MNRIWSLVVLVTLPAATPTAEQAAEVAALIKKSAPYRPGAVTSPGVKSPGMMTPAARSSRRLEKRPLFVWLAGGRDRDGSPLERC